MILYISGEIGETDCAASCIRDIRSGTSCDFCASSSGVRPCRGYLPSPFSRRTAPHKRSGEKWELYVSHVSRRLRLLAAELVTPENASPRRRNFLS